MPGCTLTRIRCPTASSFGNVIKRPACDASSTVAVVPGDIGLSAGMMVTRPRPCRRGNARRSRASARLRAAWSADSGIVFSVPNRQLLNSKVDAKFSGNHSLQFAAERRDRPDATPCRRFAPGVRRLVAALGLLDAAGPRLEICARVVLLIRPIGSRELPPALPVGRGSLAIACPAQVGGGRSVYWWTTRKEIHQ